MKLEAFRVILLAISVGYFTAFLSSAFFGVCSLGGQPSRPHSTGFFICLKIVFSLPPCDVLIQQVLYHSLCTNVETRWQLPEYH